MESNVSQMVLNDSDSVLNQIRILLMRLFHKSWVPIDLKTDRISSL